jgi:hypothetical protein
MHTNGVPAEIWFCVHRTAINTSQSISLHIKSKSMYENASYLPPDIELCAAFAMFPSLGELITAVWPISVTSDPYTDNEPLLQILTKRTVNGVYVTPPLRKPWVVIKLVDPYADTIRLN